MMGDFKQILIAELLSITGGLIAGVLLAFATDRLALIPGILILMPGFLEMRGSISGSLSARISSGLWLGVVRPRLRHNRILKGNLLAATGLAVMVSGVLGLIAWLTTLTFFGVNMPAIIAIALIAGILSNVIEAPITALTTLWLFRHGLDPNDIMGPYITTIGDIVSVISLLVAIVIV